MGRSGPRWRLGCPGEGEDVVDSYGRHGISFHEGRATIATRPTAPNAIRIHRGCGGTLRVGSVLEVDDRAGVDHDAVYDYRHAPITPWIRNGMSLDQQETSSPPSATAATSSPSPGLPTSSFTPTDHPRHPTATRTEFPVIADHRRSMCTMCPGPGRRPHPVELRGGLQLRHCGRRRRRRPRLLGWWAVDRRGQPAARLRSRRLRRSHLQPALVGHGVWRCRTTAGRRRRAVRPLLERCRGLPGRRLRCCDLHTGDDPERGGGTLGSSPTATSSPWRPPTSLPSREP